MRQRDIPDVPPALASPAAEKERADAIAHYGNPDGRGKPFIHRVYRDPQVKERLNAAFRDTCAYCETDSSAGALYDVEHYRPKGACRQREDDDSIGRGYFWLAATWQNLLPSCQRCNRPYGDKHAGERERRVSGKGNWFPLADPEARMVGPDSEENEEPLLLHPYFDDPHEHLEFIEEGLVRPRRLANGTPSPRGEATIRILGLNRERLVRARRRKLRSIERCLRRIARNEGDPARRGELDDAIEELNDLLEPGAPYLGLAEQRLGIRLPH